MPRDNSRSRSRSPRRHKERFQGHTRDHDRDRVQGTRDVGDKRRDDRNGEHTSRRRSRSPGRSPTRRKDIGGSRSRSPMSKRRRRSTSRSRSRSRSRDRRRSRSKEGRRDKETEKERDRKGKKRERDQSIGSSDTGDEGSSSKRRKDKEKRREGKRSKSKERDRERRKEKKREKKEKKKQANGSSAPQWGKYGIISDADIFLKGPEFYTWLVEERKINPETVSKDQNKKEFSKFVEDFNTATLPHEKYYHMEAYERRMSALRQGEFVPPPDDSYDPQADMKAISGAHKKKVVEHDSYLNKDQLMELRRVQHERIEAGKMKLLGMDVKQNMGVRMDGTMFDG